MTARRLMLATTLLVAAGAPAAATPAAAQRPWTLALSGAYSSSGGAHPYWDDGSVVGATVLAARRIGPALELGLEAGWHHLGSREENSRCPDASCGGPFSIENRIGTNTWHADAVLRLRPTHGSFRPYALAGLGVMQLRRHSDIFATYPDGHIDDMEFTDTDATPELVLGAGLEYGPETGRVALIGGVRYRLGLTGYDGAPGLLHLASVTAGVAIR